MKQSQEKNKFEWFYKFSKQKEYIYLVNKKNIVTVQLYMINWSKLLKNVMKGEGQNLIVG